MSREMIISQGDITDTFQVSPFEEGELVQKLTDPGWACRTFVVDKLGGTVVIDKSITQKTADNLYYEVALGPPDTEILDSRAYIWVIEVQNLTLTPKYRKELQIDLKVRQEGSYASTYNETCYDITSIGTEANNFKDRNVVVVPAVAVPGTSVIVKLKDNDGEIIQTTGYVSDAVNGANQEITLLEAVRHTPTKICVLHT